MNSNSARFHASIVDSSLAVRVLDDGLDCDSGILPLKRCMMLSGCLAVLGTVLMCAGCSEPASAPAPVAKQVSESSQPASTGIMSAQASEPIRATAPPNRMAQAISAIRSGDLESAAASLRGRLVEKPDDVAALELSGDIAARKKDFNAASLWYKTAVENSTSPSLKLFDKWVESLMHAARPFETLEALDQTIEAYPTHLQARYDRVGLSAMIGLPRMGIEDMKWLNQHQKGDPEQLIVLAEPGRVMPDGEMCEQYLEKNPEDVRLQYSLAVLESSKLEWDSAIDRLKQVVEKHPDFLPAHLFLGIALVEANRMDEILPWQKSLPAGAIKEPEYWIVAGRFAQSRGDDDQAARALWESLRLDDVTYPNVLLNLLLSLNRLGRDEDAQQVADQIRKQSTMRDALKTHIERKGESQQAAMNVADAMLALGRVWEAEGWARLSTTLKNDPIRNLRDRYMAIRSKVTVKSPWQLPNERIASRIKLGGLPKMTWGAGQATEKIAERSIGGRIRFEDQAVERGWIHTCEVSQVAETKGHWIYHAVGGGVGVIDFDLDGAPDLACAMLDGKPVVDDSSSNRLFRNVSGRFVDVGVLANYVDHGFGQGITVGDYNDDGFPDVFDPNIGVNRLFRNNGDGTFTNVTDEVGLNGTDWTTSSAMADFDGDGNADLFAIAYALGPKPYERECKEGDRTVTCTPLNFEAAKDRVWRGRGDGTFVEATDQWLDQTTPGRSLGIVAGYLDERPGLDVYVANDMSVNHLWSGDLPSQNPAVPFRMTELGSVRGLGFDVRSLSQASMGVANGDADGDGDIDFFVTHFSNDHNTYYEQVAPGIWADRSYQVGLSQISMKLLGFGTQWSDFDNDGSLDLLIANGHVDRVNDPEIDFRMPAQLVQRKSDGRWVEPERETLGDYFQADHLGRAVATLDVNRDGKMDVAITHLFDPVSLLINETTDSGQMIRFELKATKTQRDAVGAIIHARVGGRNVSAQLTAGDGYMCTNERCISIGTWHEGEAVDVSIQWPSGAIEELGTLPSGETYLVVEGSSQAFSLPEIVTDTEFK